MADYDALTYHRLVARYNGIVADTTGFFGDPGARPDLYAVNTIAAIKFEVARAGKIIDGPPELRLTAATPPRTLLLVPVRAQLESGVLRLPGALIDGVDLVAKSPILGLGTDDLIATVSFDAATIAGSTYRFDPVSYVVPTVLDADYHAGEVQTITLTGAPTSGSWAVIYGSTPTVNLSPTTTAANVQTALRAIAAIGSTGVSVAGPDGGPFVATFDTDVIPRPLPLGAVDNLTGGTLPGVEITDAYVPTTIDLTTVTRWTPTP